MRYVLLVFASFVVFTVTELEGSRILVVGPHGTKSQQNVYFPLVKELVRRGHHVTIITNYPNQELAEMKNLTPIWMEQLIIDITTFPNPFEAIVDPFKNLEMAYKIIVFFNPARIAETIFGDPRIQKLMATESFDLVIFEESCGLSCYPLGWHFKAPVITISPNVLIPGRGTSLGDQEHLSYIPFLLSSFTDQMNLFERIINVISAKLFTFVIYDWSLNDVETTFKTLINQDCPPLKELEKNISLVFANTHPSFSYPRTLPPQVIEIGGIHGRPANPLPQDLEKFVSSSEAGFIIFGIGSAFRMEDMPEEVVQAFMKTFASLPQQVVWQWKGKTRHDLPKNVLALPWLPQQDLLGHRNCKAFITHGGLNSLQEAVYHGIPILGLSLGSDQTMNILRAVKAGYAVKLDWKDLNEETLSNSVRELLQNKSYKQTAEKMSSLFLDQVQSPLERATYWTEFVLRHKGADHLKLGSVNLAPYERALIDVYIILIISAIIPIILIFFCVKRCCFRKKINEVKKKQ